MARKTKKMTAVEERFQQPLEKMLPTMVTDQGLSATADELGVSKATLGYWLLKLRIDVRRVALAPGETIEVKRVGLLTTKLRVEKTGAWPRFLFCQRFIVIF